VEQLVKWRTPITLAVLLAILLGAAYYGWQTVVDPSTDTSQSPTTPTKSTPTPKPVCVQKKTYPKGFTVHAGAYTVNVYNAGGVSGQAGDVLAALHSKGFKEGVADNPPARVTASNVSILTPSPNSPIARLVQEQFKGKVLLVPGPNLGIGVDVVIGSSFVGVDPAAPDSLTLKAAATVCTAFKTS
jgi:LytR cell envelope-related transcriptional attenuator